MINVNNVSAPEAEPAQAETENQTQMKNPVETIEPAQAGSSVETENSESADSTVKIENPAQAESTVNVSLLPEGIEWIDMASWERTTIFKSYLHTDLPYIIITGNVDVTKPLKFAHEHGISFNLTMVHICNTVADSIVNFRYRFTNDRPFIIPHNRPHVNHILPGSDVFVIGEGPWPCDDIVEFCKKTHDGFATARSGGAMRMSDKSNIDVINYTSFPWFTYTHLTRTIKKDGEDNAPKISFGKYFTEPGTGRIMMPVSVQTHHGLMDGRHVGLYYQKVQELCSNIF